MKTTPNAQLPHGCGRQEELVTYLYEEAMIQEATARVRAQAQDETRAQLASLEERLNAAHQADLTKVTRRLNAEQRAMLARANQQELTLSEWLSASGESWDRDEQ